MLPFLLLFISTTLALNSYPIVLVHGFMGWGRTEMGGIKYWGGVQGDLEEILEKDGHRVFTVAVGPFSSNWDRACELYAQLKGGRVDYGETHAKKHGHARYGRYYPTGLYPEWGTVDEDGNIRKVHLLGHSMGGATARLLDHLLQQGTKNTPTQEATNGLFQGNNDWVHSITTFSTPHHGTVIGNGFSLIDHQTTILLASLFSFLSVSNLVDIVFDTKLDQWGIGAKKPHESLKEYLVRVFQSTLFQPGKHEDICLYDLSTDGADKMNTYVMNEANRYYFSYATRDTYPSRRFYQWDWRPIQKPHKFSMLLPFQPISKFIGGVYTTFNAALDKEWQENDGVVNTVSMKGTESIVSFSGTLQPQRWHYMPLLDRLDHGGVLGFTILQDLIPIYRHHANVLRDLPQTIEKEEIRISSDLHRNLKQAISNVQMKSAQQVKQECAEAEGLKKDFCLNFLQSKPRFRS